MKHEEHIVLVLDDDLSILVGLERLLTAHGFNVRMHSDAEDFFRTGMPRVPACLLLDNQLGNCMTGVEVHAELQRRGWDLPTVFLTAHWNIHMVVNAMRAGADSFLAKPYKASELLDAVTQALQHARLTHRHAQQAAKARAIAATLTARECEIVRLILKGFLNKEIADTLGIAIVTVKVHRGRAMRKFGAGNSAELVHLASLAGLV